MNSRRPPLKTCGVSFIKLADKAYEKAQNFNGRFSSISKMLVRFFSIVSPLLILLKFRIFATFSNIDYWIFALESAIETIYPPSGYAFDKFNELVGFAEILPGKFEEVVNRFPSIIHQVPFIYSVWLRVVSCLDIFLSESRFEPVIRSKSIEGDYVLIEWESKYKEDTLLQSQNVKKDFLSTEWGLRKETNTRREFPSFKEDRMATKWGLRNEANARWESPSFKDNRMATKWGPIRSADTRLESPSFKEDLMANKWGSRNEANTCQESPRFKADYCKATKWGSRNEANTCQESSRFKADCKAAGWGSRNETNTRQESPRFKEDHIPTRNESVTYHEPPLVKQDSLSRKRVSETEPVAHQDSRNPEEDHKITNWESRKKQDTRQEPPGNEKDQVLPPVSLPAGRSYKDVLSKGPADRKVEKGTAAKGDKGTGGKGERRRRKKRWNQLKW